MRIILSIRRFTENNAARFAQRQFFPPNLFERFFLNRACVLL